MNRIYVERPDGESTNYLLNAIPVVSRDGRLTISDGRATIVYERGFWSNYLVEPLSQEQLDKLAAQQGEPAVD